MFKKLRHIAGRDGGGESTFINCCWKCAVFQNCWKAVLQFIFKFYIYLLYPPIPLLENYPTKIKALVNKDKFGFAHGDKDLEALIGILPAKARWLHIWCCLTAATLE